MSAAVAALRLLPASPAAGKQRACASGGHTQPAPAFKHAYSDRAAHQWPGYSSRAAAAAGAPVCPPLGAAAWRLPALAREASLRQERHGEWLLTFNMGYVEQAVAIARLLAETFLNAEFADGDEEGRDAPAGSVLQYQLKLLAALQWRASTLGRSFVTITAVEAASGELAGVANVAPGMTLAEAEGHVALGPGEATATLSNMAVAPAHRRRGLGRLLLRAAEQAALQYQPPTSLMALAVFRYNDAALQLYRSEGYAVDDTWTDPRWAEAAERGRVGGARRQLMLKALGPASAGWQARQAAR